jgi:hypothetical protein
MKYRLSFISIDTPAINGEVPIHRLRIEHVTNGIHINVLYFGSDDLGGTLDDDETPTGTSVLHIERDVVAGIGRTCQRILDGYYGRFVGKTAEEIQAMNEEVAETFTQPQPADPRVPVLHLPPCDVPRRIYVDGKADSYIEVPPTPPTFRPCAPRCADPRTRPDDPVPRCTSESYNECQQRDCPARNPENDAPLDDLVARQQEDAAYIANTTPERLFGTADDTNPPENHTP